jgi:hypothetical protein
MRWKFKIIEYFLNPEIIIRQAVSKILREIGNESVSSVIDFLLPYLHSPATDPLVMSSMKILVGTYGRRNAPEVLELR